MFKVVLIANNVFMIVKRNSYSPTNKPMEVHGFIIVETFENKPGANHNFINLTGAVLASPELTDLVAEARRIAINNKAKK